MIHQLGGSSDLAWNPKSALLADSALNNQKYRT